MNEAYYHVGYAAKLESGASHDIKIQKTEFLRASCAQ